MKKIKWLATGGTISCKSSEKGLIPDARNSQLENMLSVIGKSSAADVQTLMNIDSTDISCSDIKIIGNAADRCIKEGYHGIVITHGTDTMAYTAAILNKMLENCPVPVILTGSQRPFFSSGSDGKANLANALSAAENTGLRGVHILFGDKIIRGGKAYKAYSRSGNAFISPDGEYSGAVTNSKITVCGSCSYGEYRFRDSFEERTGLIKLTPMTKGEEILNAARLYRNIVIECYGLGGIPGRLLPHIKAAADMGVRFTAISQCLYEGAAMDIYEVGVNAALCGVISGEALTSEGALAEMMFSENEDT